MLTRRERTPLRKLMLLGAMAGAGALVEDTATGNPLTFITDVSKPLKSLLIPFSPRQSGTGDPSPSNIRSIIPWNGVTVFGSGKNIVTDDFTNGVLSLETGKVTYNPQFVVSGFIPVKPLTSYYFRCPTVDKTELDIVYYDKDKQYIGYTDADGYSSCNTPGRSRKTPAGCYYVRIDARNAQYNNDICINYPASVTGYVPAVGITDTDIVFPALGKNLLPESDVEYGSYGTTGGKIQDDNNKYRRLSIDLPAGNYVFSTDTPNCYFIRLLVNDSVVGTGGEVSSKAFTLTEASNVKIAWRNTDTSAITDTLHNQIEAGQSATAYEPYTNAVYGGTLDVVSGVLSVEWVKVVLNGTEAWLTVGSSDSSKSYYRVEIGEEGYVINSHIKCDKFAQTAISSTTSNTGINVVSSTSAHKSFISLRPNIEGITDSDSLKTWLSENNVTAVYELATPQEIQLTPAQITALVGDNTIWSDADGSMTAVYLKKK